MTPLEDVRINGHHLIRPIALLRCICDAARADDGISMEEIAYAISSVCNDLIDLQNGSRFDL